ncbi:hypothetical protein [Cupriavidus necator]|uniref:hypothetical protein n=1 Tax=Cupriavidus necator TaxID=106590 RepID=UPI003F73A830
MEQDRIVGTVLYPVKNNNLGFYYLQLFVTMIAMSPPDHPIARKRRPGLGWSLGKVRCQRQKTYNLRGLALMIFLPRRR